MKIIAKRAFLNATIVSDRFHVLKLMNEAISDLRVDYRWQAIDMENAEIQLLVKLGVSLHRTCLKMEILVANCLHAHGTL